MEYDKGEWRHYDEHDGLVKIRIFQFLFFPAHEWNIYYRAVLIKALPAELDIQRAGDPAYRYASIRTRTFLAVSPDGFCGKPRVLTD